MLEIHTRPDEIIPTLLQQVKTIITPILCKIIMAHFWIYPCDLEERQNDLYTQTRHPNSFSPVTLSSFLLQKLLKNLIDMHIRESVLIEQPRNPQQLVTKLDTSFDALTSVLAILVQMEHRKIGQKQAY